ncbi:MAG: DUF6265 family protein [Daejeonella sp.]
MKKSLYIFALIISLFSCHNTGKNNNSSISTIPGLNKIQQLEWLIGNWKNSTVNGQLYEIWTKRNDTLYSGHSFMITKGDTAFSERITLQLKEGNLFYIPIVSDQNKGKAVSFKLISDTKGEFVFENKEHDFPQRIIYKNPVPDSLFARIEGNVDGKFKKDEFPMTRYKK